MALTKCKECGHEISKSAASCPNCGAKIRRTSLFTKIVAVFFGLVAISMIVGHQSGDKAQTKKATKEAAQRQAEQKQLTAMTPEQRAEAEKKRQEEERARQAAEQQRLGLKWNYEESDDKMGRGKIKNATVRSLNQVDFGFPYSGSQRATLNLRIHPKYGRDVILILERGQFLCGLDGCNVQVRFGGGKPLTFSASEPADHSTTYLFIRNYNRFIANTRKVSKVYIEAQFYQEGNKVFEFDVSDLKWR